MPEQMMWVSWEDGTALSQSRKSPGAFSPLTRDSNNNLSGQVVLSDLSDEAESSTSLAEGELPEGVAQLAGAVAAVVAVGLLERAAVAVRPHVASWWNGRARPAVSSAAEASRTRLRRMMGRQDEETGLQPADESATHRGPSELEVTDADDGAVMTTMEAEQRVTAALLARAFSDEQIRTVLNSRIVDHEGREVELALTEVSQEEITGQIQLLLEANPGLLDGLNDLLNETTQTEPILLHQGRD